MQPKNNPAIQAIMNEQEFDEVIQKCSVCHVGMVDDDKPYVLGFNFGYKDRVIYLHSAKEGKKIEILKRNNNVCVEFDADHLLFARHENVACSWRMRYRSVLAHGKAVFVDEYDEKIEALKIFMKHHSGIDFNYNKPAVDNILIIKIEIETMTGRKFEYIG